MDKHTELNVKYASAPADYKPQNFKTCSCNNQLGEIHKNVRYFVPLSMEETGFNISAVPGSKNIMHAENVIDKTLASRVRQFLNDIPFNQYIRPLDDITNPPSMNVWEDCLDKIKVLKIINDKVGYCANPLNWKWEMYGGGIFRAAPQTLEDFIFSPVFELFDVMWYRFHFTLFGGVDLGNGLLKRSCWVIQRTIRFEAIGLHMDDDQWRKIAFCYYLTPDDWCSRDGGVLVCHDPQSKKLVGSFVPVFNSMVGWVMDKHILGPLHCVTLVMVRNEMARIALVGFYCG